MLIVNLLLLFKQKLFVVFSKQVLYVLLNSEAGMTYQNFDLLFERSGEHYRVRLLDSPAGQATFDFALPFSDSELEGFFLFFRRSGFEIGQ
jgi:hypothetical protein